MKLLNKIREKPGFSALNDEADVPSLQIFLDDINAYFCTNKTARRNNPNGHHKFWATKGDNRPLMPQQDAR